MTTTGLLRTLGLGLALALAAPLTMGCGGADDEAADAQDATAATGRFETFQGEDGLTYFQLLAANGERVLRSQGYKSASGAKKGMASVRKNGALEASYRVLAAKNGEVYFNLVATNGEIIGTSETYSTPSNAARAVNTVIGVLKNATSAAAEKSGPKFETFTGQDGQTFFRLRAKNGEIVLQSEGYSSKSAADKGIASVKKTGAKASAYVVLEGQGNQFYFNLVASNGKVVGRGETYASHANAVRGAQTVESIVRDLAGAAAKTDAEVKAALELAAEGLTFMSESDYPYGFVLADLGPGDTSITEELVRAKLGSYVDSDPDADKPMAELFGMSGTWEEWTDGDKDCPTTPDDFDAQYCRDHRDLDLAIAANLTDLRIFYFGAHGEPGQVDGIGVSVFIVGLTPEGNLAGLRTLAIWT